MLNDRRELVLLSYEPCKRLRSHVGFVEVPAKCLVDPPALQFEVDCNRNQLLVLWRFDRDVLSRLIDGLLKNSLRILALDLLDASHDDFLALLLHRVLVLVSENVKL